MECAGWRSSCGERVAFCRCPGRYVAVVSVLGVMYACRCGLQTDGPAGAKGAKGAAAAAKKQQPAAAAAGGGSGKLKVGQDGGPSASYEGTARQR